MKTRFGHFMGLVMGLGLLLSACSSSKTDDGGTPTTPNFPTPTISDIEAGKTITLHIEPNAAWEVSIPTTEGSYFSILDGTTSTYVKRGVAGSFDIVIAAAAIEDYNSDHVCTVNMKMNNKTQSIATLTLRKLARELTVRQVLLDEAGEFTYAERGSELSFTYDEKPISETTLTWLDPNETFRMQILVEANFEWGVNAADLPDWLKLTDLVQSSDPKTGRQVEVSLIGVPDNYPVNGDSRTIHFYDPTSDGQTFDLKVVFPKSRDFIRVLYGETLKFNAKGQYFNPTDGGYVDDPAYGWVRSIQGSKFYIINRNTETGALSTAQDDIAWVSLTEAAWTDDNSKSPIKGRSVKIDAAAHSGFAREAVIVALPVDKVVSDASQLISGNDIRSEYQPYIGTTIKQETNSGAIEANVPLYIAGEGASFERLRKADFLSSLGATNAYAYNLTYSKKPTTDTDAALIFNTAFAGYKVYDCEMQEIVDDNAKWLSVRNTKDNTYMIDMTPAKDPTASKSAQTLGVAHVGYVAFTDAAGKVYAVIQCYYDESISITLMSIALANTVSGATFTEITDPNDEYYKAFIGDVKRGGVLYKLTYTSATVKAKLDINGPDGYKATPYEYTTYASPSSWLTFGTDASITMKSTSRQIASLLFTDSSQEKIYARVICVLDI